MGEKARSRDPLSWGGRLTASEIREALSLPELLDWEREILEKELELLEREQETEVEES